MLPLGCSRADTTPLESVPSAIVFYKHGTPPGFGTQLNEGVCTCAQQMSKLQSTHFRG